MIRNSATVGKINDFEERFKLFNKFALYLSTKHKTFSASCFQVYFISL